MPTITEPTADTSAQKLTGALKPFGLADVLRELSAAGATGVLAVRVDDVAHRIFVESGMLVAASPGTEEGLLGRTLVRLGLLELEDVEAAVELCDGQPLGRYLVDNELIDEEQLRSALAEQIRFTVRSMIDWRAGSYAFTEEPTGLAHLPLPQLSMADVILDAARSLASTEAIRDLLSRLGGNLAPARDATLSFQNVHLSPAEGYLLSRLDGTTDVAGAIVLSSLEEDDTVRLLYGLVASGLVAPDGRVVELGAIAESPAEPEPASDTEPVSGAEAAAETGPAGALEAAAVPRQITEPLRPPASAHDTQPIVVGPSPAVDPEPAPGEADDIPEDATYYELLGVEPEVDADQLEKGFRVRARSYHPDRATTPAERARLENTFARICRAKRILSDPDRRASYDDYLAACNVTPEQEAERAAQAQAEMAKDLVNAGRRALREFDYTRAMSYLDRACKLAPDDVECQILLAETQAHNPKWYKQSREMLEAVIEKYQWNLRARLALAGLHAKSKRTDEARAVYQEVLQMEPGNRAATEGLAKLDGGTSATGSLLTRLGKGKSSG